MHLRHTGDPKGVVISHANLLANVRAMWRASRVDSADTSLSWLPLYHDLGLSGACIGSLYVGYRLVLMSPLEFLARPSRWCRIPSGSVWRVFHLIERAREHFYVVLVAKLQRSLVTDPS